MAQPPVQSNPTFLTPTQVPAEPQVGLVAEAQNTAGQATEAQRQAVPAKADLFDTLRFQQKALLTSQSPEQLGHKMGQERLPQQQARPQRPMAEPQHYRALLAEAQFQQKNSRDTPTRRYLEAKGYSEGRQNADGLSKSQIVQLFQNRSQVQNRDALVRVIRQAIKEYKNEGRDVDGKGNKKLFESTLSEGSKLVRMLLNGDGESEFENILKRLNQGESPIKDLPEGREASFAKKSGKNWEGFYTNLKNMGQGEEASLLKTAEIENATFRGLMESMAEGETPSLVSDLMYSENGRLVTEKFVRVLIENPELMAILEKMDPGDPLTKEIFQKLGNELQLLRLVHKPEVMTDVAREQAREAAMSQLRSPGSASAMKSLERRLEEERERRKKGELDSADDLGADYFPTYKNEEERKPGTFNLYVLMSYTITGILLTLILYGIIRIL